MLGDIIISEPGALIGFAGRRVIEQTLQEQLPDNFQTAEYLLKHGLVDLVVPRPLLKQALAEMLTFYQEAPLRKPGKIPHGVAGPLSQTQAVNLTSQWSKGELTKGSRLQSVLNFLNQIIRPNNICAFFFCIFCIFHLAENKKLKECCHTIKFFFYILDNMIFQK